MTQIRRDLVADLSNRFHAAEAERDRLKAISAELLGALERAFNLIKESGFKSGLIEEEFDATLHHARAAIARAKGEAP